MADKKIALISLLIALSAVSCKKQIDLEPLSIPRVSENETGSLEGLLQRKVGVESAGNLTVVEVEPPALNRTWKRGPLPPPTPPQPQPREEEKKEEFPAIKPEELVGVKGPVSLNVENMPLSDFIIYALGELLRVPFLIDEDVRNMKKPVTLRMPRDLPPEEVLIAVVDYLVKQDLRVEQKGRVLSITRPKPRPAPPPPPPPQVDAVIIDDEVPETSGLIAYFYPLRYVRPPDIDFLIRDVFRTGLEIRHYPKENALYLTGPGHTIRRVVELIRLLDTPTFTQRKLYLFRLNYWDPDLFVSQLSDLLGKLGYPIAKSVREPGILMIPLKTFNGVLFAFPDEETQRYVVEWIKKFDTPESAGTEERFFVYRPRFSKAKDLGDALQNLLGATGPARPQPTPPPQPPQQATPQPQQRGATITGRGFNIGVDEKRNLLLISTTPSLYQQLLQILQELDKPPRQVLIEATILELTLKDELKMGLEWYIRNLWSGNYTLFQALGVPSGPGLTFSLITDTRKFNMLINLFAGRGLTNILSTPRLMVLDNQEATIQVGTDVPVVTGEVATAQAVTGTTTGVVRSIQYRSTGIILRVKPTIFAEDMLQLDITQEVSEMGASPPGLQSPTILVRRITSSVVAGNGQSIVLGGLISNTRGREESKVPLLGDIPLLGNLFKSQANEERKTELIVLIRPYVVRGLEEATAITREIRERLKWLK